MQNIPRAVQSDIRCAPKLYGQRFSRKSSETQKITVTDFGLFETLNHRCRRTDMSEIFSATVIFGGSSGLVSKTGRIRFRRALFQTPSSVSFCPHRVPGENSVSSSQPTTCVTSFSQNSPSLPQNSVRLSEFSSPKQYSRNSIPPFSYCLSVFLMCLSRLLFPSQSFASTCVFESACSGCCRLCPRA